MEYKKLDEINKTLKTTDVKGKDYVEVNERVTAFRKIYENGSIITHLISCDNGVCIFKAEIYENITDEKPISTGTAYEKEDSSFINKTSYIENCETSAVGRALGFLGIGIGTSIASAEEVKNAIENQKPKTDYEKPISSKQAEALKEAIENNKLQDVFVLDILSQYNYSKIEDIKIKDYVKIVSDLKKGVNE